MEKIALEDALAGLDHTAQVLAGGTDFYPSYGDQPVPANVHDLSRIAGLDGIAKTAKGWRIGATVTWTELIETGLPRAFDSLKQAAREVGSVQIQNAATIGGNLCNASPAADGVPPLLCLDAEVELASVSGVRTLPLSDFIVAPRRTAKRHNELLTAIHIPDFGSTARSVFNKLGARRYLVISIAMVSVLLEQDKKGCLSRVRIAVGSCSAVAQRLYELENLLLGQPVRSDILSMVSPALLAVLKPIDDVRATAVYRHIAAREIVCRLLAQCVRLLDEADHFTTETASVESTHKPVPVLSDLQVRFQVNGRSVTTPASTHRLSTYLRESGQQLDVKIGCNAGDCGACTVLVDDRPVCSCLTAVSQLNGKRVDTLAGLAESEPLMQKLQQSFLIHGAAQCGICTPGMMVSAVSLLRDVPQPTEEQVKNALGGVLCRCTGYRKIISAVLNASACPTLKNSIHLGANSDQVAAREINRSAVGESIIRLDGIAKVDGSDRFGDDVAYTLGTADSQSAVYREVRVIRSPYHHARFSFGDIQSIVDKYSQNIDGVLTASDIPGANAFGVIPPFIDQPVFAESVVRFKGEAVAAVVGHTDWLDTVIRELPIHWEELEAVLDPDSAQARDVLRIHEHAENNVLCRGLVQVGDAKRAIDNAEYKASGTFTTGFIEHAYIEPEAGYAERVGDSLHIHGCTQAPYMNRYSLAQIMAIDEESIRIIPSSVGGGFGSKLDLSFQPFVALAAWHFKKRVRMTFSRQESMQSTTKRHPALMHVAIGADKRGRIQGMSFNGTFNTGAYASWGPTVANRVPIHASGPYATPHYCAKTHGVYTHCAPAGAFRGFGVPQAAIAQESLYDELANSIGMDRLEFRLINALDNHQRTVTGQVFSTGVGIKSCLNALQTRWRSALEDATAFNQAAIECGSTTRRGVGIASGWYGCGNTSMPNPSTIKAGITLDGSICLHQGAVDIGQGSNTVITQIFAETLGVQVQQIRLLGADSAVTPDAGKTSASRQTFVSGNAALRSAMSLREQIARQTNCTELLTIDIDAGKLIVNAGRADSTALVLKELSADEDGYVFVARETYDPPTGPMDENGQGDPYAVFGYAAQMVSLDVDTGLGTVSLLQVAAAHDVGRAINPLLVEGQIHGGIAQGIGLALMEEFIPGRTENLHDYLIPTIGDVPPVDTIIVEERDLHGPMGAKGLGEHVLIPTAPAILNAIAHASGARVRDVPATPDKILAALHTNRDGC
jgi:CO/xanthine dehydrogenase Mo-binding subunit/CO/xanthine dehydrogenase FAD-binding subunit/aerobic-type carbon monoxide dehydrogenase small subunit (CoxS/CutS family)